MSEVSSQKCPSCGESVPLEYSVCPFCGFGIHEYELKQFSYKPKRREVIERAISFYRSPFKTSGELGVATETRGANMFLYFFSVFLSLRLFFTIIKAGFSFSLAIAIGSVGDPPRPFITLKLGFILFLVNLLILPLVIYLIYKILFVLGSWLITRVAGLMGAEIKTKQVKTIMAYSIIPVVLGEFLGIFFTLIGPSGGLGDTASVTFNEILSFMESFYSSGVMIAFKFLMLLAWIVTLVYSTIGVRTVGKMAWVNAALTMLLPLGTYVWFFYITGMFG
ncbi:MAG: hypothetical protein ACTSSL_06490 [Candidatus Heimdallarchaeaceae archaeon]